MSVVLNRSVVNRDWCISNLWGSHLQSQSELYYVGIMLACLQAFPREFVKLRQEQKKRGTWGGGGEKRKPLPLLLPSPSPIHFFCSRSKFCQKTRLETLAMQASIMSMLHLDPFKT